MQLIVATRHCLCFNNVAAVWRAHYQYNMLQHSTASRTFLLSCSLLLSMCAGGGPCGHAIIGADVDSWCTADEVDCEWRRRPCIHATSHATSGIWYIRGCDRRGAEQGTSTVLLHRRCHAVGGSPVVFWVQSCLDNRITSVQPHSW